MGGMSIFPPSESAHALAAREPMVYVSYEKGYQGQRGSKRVSTNR